MRRRGPADGVFSTARHDEQARQWHKDYLRLASLIKAATVQEAAVADVIRRQAPVPTPGSGEPQAIIDALEAAVDEEDALQFVPRNDGYGT